MWAPQPIKSCAPALSLGQAWFRFWGGSGNKMASLGTPGHLGVGGTLCRAGLGDLMVGKGPPRGPQLPGGRRGMPKYSGGCRAKGFIKELGRPSRSSDCPGAKGVREGGAGIHSCVALPAASCRTPFPPELGYSVNLKPSESLSPEGRDSVLPVCVVLSPCLGVLQSTWPHGPSSL